MIRLPCVTALAAALLAGVLSAGAPAASAASVQPSWDPGGHYRIVLDEEFSSAASLRGWNTGWFGTGITRPVNPHELDCYSSAHDAVRGGTLDMTLTHAASTCGGTRHAWTGAIVTTDGRFSLRYGETEVRAYLPGSGGQVWDWPSVVVNGQAWPSEIDIMEGLGGSAAWHLHTAEVNGPGGVPGGDYAGWHDFGLAWSPGGIRFFWDGRLAGQSGSSAPDVPLYLIITDSAGDSGPLHADTVRIAWVRAWAA